MKLVCTVGMLFAWAGVSWAQDDDKKKQEEERIQRLERELEQLKKDREAEKAEREKKDKEKQEEKTPSPKPNDVEFKASFTDGFHITSMDKRFDIHIGGRYEEEFRFIMERPQGVARTDPNTFLTREAFLSVDGTIFGEWGFKLNGDFSTVSNAQIEEGYVEWKRFKEFRVRFGSFKEPTSIETTASPRFAELIQRSALSRFNPNVELGAEIYGTLWEGIFNYELAIVNGRNNLANSGRENIDDNDGKEVALRLAFYPWATEKDSFLHKLRLAVYGTYGRESEGVGANSSDPSGWGPGTLIRSVEFNAGYLKLPAAGFRFDGTRSRIGFETVYAYGPFTIRGEYWQRRDETLIPANGSGQDENLLMTGWYVTLAYVLTGEEKNPDDRIVPLHPFDLSKGDWGAFEVAFRWDSFTIDSDTLDDMGTDFSSNSNRVMAWTVGINWWPVSNVRIAANFVYEEYHSEVVWTSDQSNKFFNGFLFHFQVDF